MAPPAHGPIRDWGLSPAPETLPFRFRAARGQLGRQRPAPTCGTGTPLCRRGCYRVARGVSGPRRGGLGCVHAAATPAVHKTPEIPARVSFRVEVFDIEFMTGQSFPGGSEGDVAAGGSVLPRTRLRSGRRLGERRVRLLPFLRAPKGAGGAAEGSRRVRHRGSERIPASGTLPITWAEELLSAPSIVIARLRRL